MKLIKKVEHTICAGEKDMINYIWIKYLDSKTEKEILNFNIQFIWGTYTIYFKIPIQLNVKLQTLQRSQLSFISFDLANLKEVDKVINKYLEFLENIPDKKINEIVKAVRECGTDYREEAN